MLFKFWHYFDRFGGHEKFSSFKEGPRTTALAASSSSFVNPKQRSQTELWRLSLSHHWQMVKSGKLIGNWRSSLSSLSTEGPGAGWAVTMVTCASCPACPRGATMRFKWPIRRRRLPLVLSGCDTDVVTDSIVSFVLSRVKKQSCCGWCHHNDWQTLTDSVLDFVCWLKYFLLCTSLYFWTAYTFCIVGSKMPQ